MEETIFCTTVTNRKAKKEYPFISDWLKTFVTDNKQPRGWGCLTIFFTFFHLNHCNFQPDQKRCRGSKVLKNKTHPNNFNKVDDIEHAIKSFKTLGILEEMKIKTCLCNKSKSRKFCTQGKEDHQLYLFAQKRSSKFALHEKFRRKTSTSAPQLCKANICTLWLPQHTNLFNRYFVFK